MSITFGEYQRGAAKTAEYKRDPDKPWNYPLVALGGEVGELMNKMGKVLRGDYKASDVRLAAIGEVGDILWNLSEFCKQMEISLEYAAEYNLEKLAKRKEEGKIKGDGDDR